MERLELLVRYHDDFEKETPLEKISKIEIGDWIDLRASRTVEMKPGGFYLIQLGVSIKLPEGYEAHIVPRSSTYKRWQIIQTNHVGIIDNSYSGDNDIWQIPVLSLGNATIHKNDRICQFRIVKKMPEIAIKEVDHLDGPNRGGFGSTGEK